MDIKVPVEMIEAATPVYIRDRELVASILKDSLLWISEHPIMPTRVQELQLYRDWSCYYDPDAPTPIEDQIRYSLKQWQRRMFLAEP